MRRCRVASRLFLWALRMIAGVSLMLAVTAMAACTAVPEPTPDRLVGSVLLSDLDWETIPLPKRIKVEDRDVTVFDRTSTQGEEYGRVKPGDTIEILSLSQGEVVRRGCGNLDTRTCAAESDIWAELSFLVDDDTKVAGYVSLTGLGLFFDPEAFGLSMADRFDFPLLTPAACAAGGISLADLQRGSKLDATGWQKFLAKLVDENDLVISRRELEYVGRMNNQGQMGHQQGPVRYDAKGMEPYPALHRMKFKAGVHAIVISETSHEMVQWYWLDPISYLGDCPAEDDRALPVRYRAESGLLRPIAGIFFDTSTFNSTDLRDIAITTESSSEKRPESTRTTRSTLVDLGDGGTPEFVIIDERSVMHDCSEFDEYCTSRSRSIRAIHDGACHVTASLEPEQCGYRGL